VQAPSRASFKRPLCILPLGVRAGGERRNAGDCPRTDLLCDSLRDSAARSGKRYSGWRRSGRQPPLPAAPTNRGRGGGGVLVRSDCGPVPTLASVRQRYTSSELFNPQIHSSKSVIERNRPRRVHNEAIRMPEAAFLAHARPSSPVRATIPFSNDCCHQNQCQHRNRRLEAEAANASGARQTPCARFRFREPAGSSIDRKPSGPQFRAGICQRHSVGEF